ncbi:MAG TPA: hypothetical protein VJ836_07580 [Candidatus Saccharimonadales bacterium]|nr:hypothetical protein [Candidatus Saccharimonadales bacterium]
MKMNNNDESDHRITRKRHTLSFVALFTAIGIIMSEAVWLAIYDAHWTPAVEF